MYFPAIPAICKSLVRLEEGVGLRGHTEPNTMSSMASMRAFFDLAVRAGGEDEENAAGVAAAILFLDFVVCRRFNFRD